MIKRQTYRSGFTLVELIVVIVIMGILSAMMVRVRTAQDRARIGAAEADVTLMRQALGLYETDYSTYNIKTISSYADFVGKLKRPDGTAYMTLPDTTNFTDFTYSGNDSTYTITVKAKDNRKTIVIGTPKKTYH
ncbi:MAG: prepilin-type N-terminal cleavage/methylation domain-containing protein [bacterium]|nr:prepilin-type N-terminal cleavage/methylation domain-containing protein [bacterium]